MSAREQVAKLEALLAQIHERRSVPRVAAASMQAHIDLATTTPPPATPTAPPSPAAVQAREPASVRSPAIDAEVSPPSEPVSAVSLTRTAPPPPEDVANVEVEVEEGMAEVDLDGLDDVEPASLSDSVADLDTVAGAGDEDVPASSRRPVQIEPPLEELAFGDAVEAKAPHPAPPESGRMVAAPAVVEADAEMSGVRSVPESEPPPPPVARPPSFRPEPMTTSATLVAAQPPATPPPPPPPVAAAKPAPVALTSEVIRPVMATASPAVFHGEPPAEKPATFGDLLDATLGL